MFSNFLWHKFFIMVYLNLSHASLSQFPLIFYLFESPHFTN